MCHPLSRRDLLRAGAVAAAALSLPALGQAQEAHKSPASPDDALARLWAGNARFVRGEPEAPHRTLSRVRELATSQAPFAAFLGCADSRVPIEILFDQGFGDLFVVRNAGNITTPETIGSLEFGTQVLGAQVLFVLGHRGCGAVSATMRGDAVPGQISTLYAHLQPAVDDAGGSVDRAVEANVRHQVTLLRRASPVVRGLVREGRLVVAGGVYDLATGKVAPVEVPS